MKIKKIVSAVCAMSIVLSSISSASAYFYYDDTYYSNKKDYISEDIEAKLVEMSDCYMYSSESGGKYPTALTDVWGDKSDYSITIPSVTEDGTEIDGVVNAENIPDICILSPGISFIKGYLTCSVLVAPESVRDLSDMESYNLSCIQCYPKTYAESYAIENNIQYQIIGDLNNDRISDFRDFDYLMDEWAALGEYETEYEKLAHDMNYDSEINILDVIKLKENLSEVHGGNVGASTVDAESAPNLRNMERKPVGQESVSEYIDFYENTIDDFLLKSDNDKKNTNPVCSPASIYMAMSMAAECANGNTQKEMLDVLKSEDIESLREQNNTLFRDLYQNEYSSYCQIANSLWLNSPQFEFKKDALDILADKYYAVSFKKDFFDENVPNEISSWINKNTDGKFSPEIKIEDPSTEIMDIINTIAFKSSWINKFSTAKTDTFHIDSKTDVETDFLNELDDDGTVGFADNYMKYTKKMENNYQMNFILPDEGTDVCELLNDPETVKEFTSDDLDYQTRKVYFKVPKFDVSSSYDLVDTFKELGISDAFSAAAGDFTNAVIRNKHTSEYINKIVHEATLKIDEKGCEAAAYTLIQMLAGCAAPPENEPVYFYCDRPFFYYVSDSAGTPVFAGILNDPTSK